MSEESQTKNEIKGLKDVNSIEDLDFNKIQLIRGETPRDINEKCLQLCKDYLSGNWSQQTVDTIEVRRITGGLMNQIYYCGIKESDNKESVPQEVAVKFYGSNIFIAEESRIRDVVIALKMSECELGPKIYGLFEDGQIQKFYKHRQFTLEEQTTPKIRDQVFKTLAKIHSLDVPIKKNNKIWMSDLFSQYYEKAFENIVEKEINEYNCEVLKTIDLKSEIDWLISVGEKSGSPIVFTHNDYRSSNLLITEPNDELIVCDFDFTGYSYRGYDFVRLAEEWGRKQWDWTQFDGEPFNGEAFKPLIEIYVEECVRIHGKSYSENEINSVDNILREVKIFLLFQSLFFTTLLLIVDDSKDLFQFNRKVSMELAEMNIQNYLRIKNILKQQNIIE